MDSETAWAKINLALHVRRRRPDGYHDIETVFAFCQGGDLVTAAPADALTLTIEGRFAGGLSATDNLIMKAARAMSPDRGATLRLVKNLPVAAGIGGGSADAAATLRLLSRLWARPLLDQATQTKLGADVPACVVSQTMRGEGVGEVMTPVPSVSEIPVLLVNPMIALSTADVFAAWDGVDRGRLGDWRDGRNDLQEPACRIVPEIAMLLALLSRQRGVTLARMSGSGATCFALFEDVTHRDEAEAAIHRAAPAYWTFASLLR